MNTEFKDHKVQNQLSMLATVMKLAWPVSLQSVLAAVLGMIDIIMVAHLGEESVAGMGLANRILFVLLMIGGGFGVCAGIFIAQYAGARKHHTIPVIIAQILIIATVVMLPLMVMTNLFATELSALGSHSENVIGVSRNYLLITLPSILFLLVYQIFEGALRGLKQVYIPLLFGAATMLVNIVLNYVLINGLDVGSTRLFSAMGTEGAAWATTISRVTLLAGLLSYLVYKKHICLPSNAIVTLKTPECGWTKLMGNSLPLCLNFAVWALGTFIYQVIFGSLGPQSLAIMSMLAPVEGIVISLFLGFATAASVLIGQKLGANQMTEAYKLGTRLTLVITVLAMICGFLVITLQTWILSPYRGYSIDTLELAAQVLTIMCIGIAIKTSNMMLSLGVLRAGGDNKFCLFSDSFGMWLIGIPLTWWVAGKSGALLWVVITTYSEEICKGGLFYWRLFSKKWQRNITESDSGHQKEVSLDPVG